MCTLHVTPVIGELELRPKELGKFLAISDVVFGVDVTEGTLYT